METKKPDHEVKVGNVRAAVWDNDGLYSIKISRIYRDKDEQWRSSSSLGQRDLPNLCFASIELYNWIQSRANS